MSRISILAMTLTAVVAALVVTLLLRSSAAASPGDTVADRVFGQGGSFTSGTCNLGGRSASSICNAYGAAVDAAGRLYVADTGNNRVLEYDAPMISTAANRVFGQAGSFASGTCDLGGISAGSLCSPTGVAIDTFGRLYVADFDNNRVLEYDSPLTSSVADRVFGQGGSFTNNSQNLGGIDAGSLFGPRAVATDAAGHLYVSDSGNNRMLEYDSPMSSALANRVFGQGGSFTSNAPNQGGVSASTLQGPWYLTLDAAGHLYIADQFNHRVLEYDSPLTSQVANRVFGQGGSFTSTNCQPLSATSLCYPMGVGMDGAGRLYVGDSFDNRVLEYNSPLSSSVADRVFGQANSFTSGFANLGGPSATSLYFPADVVTDTVGDLFVVDNSNNRLLEYDLPALLPAPTASPTASPMPTSTTHTSSSPTAAAVGGLVDLTTTGGEDGGSGTTALLAGLLIAVAVTGAAVVGFRRASMR